MPADLDGQTPSLLNANQIEIPYHIFTHRDARVALESRASRAKENRMSVHVTDKHLKRAEKLVQKAHANGGLAPVDLNRFWADQDKAIKNSWAQDCPQAPLGIGMAIECMFEELGVKADWHRLFHDDDFRVDLEKRYNVAAEKIVGRRLLGEWKPDPKLQWPPIKELHDIFEAKNTWHDVSYWLQQSAHTEDELKALLDRVEKRLGNLRAFMFPATWAEAKARITAAGGQVPLYRGQRGPVTLPCPSTAWRTWSI